MKKGAVICEFVNLCISPFFDCEKILKLENKRIYYIYILYIYILLNIVNWTWQKQNSQIHKFTHLFLLTS